MRPVTILVFFLITTIVGCESRTSETNPALEVQIGDLTDLFNKIGSGVALDSRMHNLGFNQRSKGIYVSFVEIGHDEPMHWIQIPDAGKYSSVVFKTLNRTTWNRLIRQLDSVSTPEVVDGESSEITTRYTLDTLVVKTFEPALGVYVTKNSLYEIMVANPKD